MRIDLFLWDYQNIDHVARHGVHPGEVDDVLDGDYRTVTTHSGRYPLMGRSAGGRYLLVIVDPLGEGRWYVVTARDMTKSERHRFLKLLWKN